MRLVSTAARALTATAAAAALALVPISPVAADPEYHTQRMPVTGPAGGRGTVINTHTEGRVNYGIERYQLRGVPAGDYLVQLTIYLEDTCTELFPFPPEVGHPFTTALLTANRAGNATGGAKFLVRDVAQLITAEGTVYGVWSFTNTTSGIRYATGCEPVTLDLPG